MEKRRGNQSVLRWASLVGILAVLLTVASDFILLGKPVSAWNFMQLGTESMAGLEPWRIASGTMLGVGALPLQLGGLVSVYYGLKPAGIRLAMIVLLPMAHALAMGVAFHMAYAFIGTGWNMLHVFSSSKDAGMEMMQQFAFYWNFVIYSIAAEICFSSAAFAWVIGKKKTLYPRWMMFLNPVFILLFLFPVIFLLPAPVGGFIAPAYLNLCSLAFFVLSFLVVYKRSEGNPDF